MIDQRPEDVRQAASTRSSISEKIAPAEAGGSEVECRLDSKIANLLTLYRIPPFSLMSTNIRTSMEPPGTIGYNQ